MAEERKVRIQRRVLKGGPGGRKRVVAIATGGEVDLHVEGIDPADLTEEIEEEDENGHTVLKIRIPRVRTDTGDADPLVRAAGVSGAVENLESEIGALVRRAREQGYTWTQVGLALGISKQAAWERFSGED